MAKLIPIDMSTPSLSNCLGVMNGGALFFVKEGWYAQFHNHRDRIEKRLWQLVVQRQGPPGRLQQHAL